MAISSDPLKPTEIKLALEHEEDVDDNFTFPEMSPIEKEIIIEWCSLTDNENYQGEPFNGVNLHELLRILVTKYNEVTQEMSNKSIQYKLIAMGWTPCVDSQGNRSSLNNPMCSLLLMRMILSLAAKEKKDTAPIKNKLIKMFEDLKNYYFEG